MASRSPRCRARRSGSRRRGNTASNPPSRSCKISFVDKRPETFWETLGPDEYGFWANVNPDVPHPRWSQAKETELTTGNLRPTMLFNGYGEQVAALYKGLEKEPLFM